MIQQTIGIAMSGGVDSTAAAILLQRDYTVTGFFMQLAQPDIAAETRRAQDAADRLGIPLQVVDLRDAFEREVLSYFAETYFQGRTPNPCVRCNQRIKFGVFLDYILASGVDLAATGHYAQISCSEGIYHLHRGIDSKKDQSYFLAGLSQQQLSRVLFPLGEMVKEDIFRLVEEHGFPSFRGSESQDICFLAEKSTAAFLQARDAGKAASGNIIDTSGKILGSHTGIQNYTVGQRRGLGISAEYPLYVLALDSTTNSVIVGPNEGLLKTNLTLQNPHWITGSAPIPEKNYTVRIRYGHAGAKARLTCDENNCYTAHFSTPQRAITPGQFAVIYDGDEVLGAGEIVA